MSDFNELPDVLKCYYLLLDQLSFLFEDEISFSLSDRKRFLKFTPSEHMPAFSKEGEPVPKGDVLMQAMDTGEIRAITTDRCTFGFCIRVVAVPIRDSHNQIIGGISYGRSLKNSNDVLELSKSVINSIKNINDISNHLNEAIGLILKSNEEILNEINDTSEQVKNTDRVIEFVKSVASQTNLLGLNASIEAARAGDYGRGFSVVAKEIRKLSNSSEKSMNEINTVLKNIQNSVTEIQDKIGVYNEISANQKADLEEISTAINKLSENADMLQKMAQKL